MRSEPNRSEAKRTDAPSKKYKARGWMKQTDAEILGPILERLARDRTPLAEGLVALSTPKDAPTHHLFEWNDKKAAHEYRLQQAQFYIRTIEITIEDAPEPVRAFPSVTIDGKQEYVSIARVLTDQELMGQLLGEATRELASWQRRYKCLESLAKTRKLFRESRAVLS